MGEVSITRDEAVCSDGGSLEPSPPGSPECPGQGVGKGPERACTMGKQQGCQEVDLGFKKGLG